MKRPPAGHAAAGFSAIWALFTEVLPKAKTYEPAELREIALKLDLPEGSWSTAAASSSPTSTGRRIRRMPARICAPRSASGSGQKTGNEQVFPPKLATARAGHGAAAELEQALT